ncbi:TonB-dependent receptor plug domain-containing protein [Longimicrobium sp.]|uniref:TonB-dependent receptor plug domain-containing protein n=1 Tax=Longimicrobium sp. TaxID=2029185 RepID=UPI002E3368A1|nr:TonB-dependent receptor plug domain-containing protein [Longimicrobium sp.]HEX6038089.1 TonB-dependent receptor plug domain-containing protein [Longimicrobium sp.]
MMLRRPALAGLAAAALLAAADLRAQDTIPAPPRQDTASIAIPGEAVRGDTIPDAARPDSVPADSTRPAPNFPLYRETRQSGFSAASWVFGPRELGRFHGLTLTELLERIPGLVMTRGGGVGQPNGVSAFSSGGGRTRVFLDGWEVRPLSGTTLNLENIPLLDVQEVRVTRGLQETRVDVQTLRLSDRRPFAQIEGGEGDFATRMLRGLFARPLGDRLMVHVGIDVVETQGFRRRENYSANTGVARLSYAFSPDRALQVEYRTTGIDAQRQASGTDLPRESFDRGELVLRGRGRFFGRRTVCADTSALPADSAARADSAAVAAGSPTAGDACPQTGGVWLDGAIGRSWSSPLDVDTITLERESVQAMLRATVDVPLGTVTGTARVHRVDEEGYAANATELSARAELTPVPWLAAWGEARTLTHGGVTGLELEASGRAGPWGGLSVFGSVAAGTRGLRFWRDSAVVVRNLGHALDPALPELDTLPVVLFRDTESTANGFRAGAEWMRGSIMAGAAFLVQDVDAVVPYGFWYERGLGPESGETVSGVEAYASIPVIWRQVRLDATYTDFFTAPARPYLPVRFGRAALEYHWIFRGGNLEPTLRAEVIGRGPARTIDAQTGALTGTTEQYAIVNFLVQFRVLDVRAFWRLENAFNRETAFDIPGLTLPGQRALFGVRWFFRD